MESKVDKIVKNMVSMRLPDIERLENMYGLSYFVQAVSKEEVVNLRFVAELIASYNPKKHTAKISGRNLKVTKGALAAALKLPDTINVNVDEDEEDAIDFDDEEDEEYARFLLNFVLTYMYLNSEQKVAVAAKVHQMSHCLMSGRPKDFDFSGFMWVLVENEILKGSDIKECYYAQHMQCLIRDQLSDLFVVTPNDDDAGGAQMDVDAGARDLNFSLISGSGSGKKQFKEIYKRRRRNNYKGGTASGSGS